MSNQLHLDFSPAARKRLDALKLKTKASSYAEVIRNALQLYEALIEKTEAGEQSIALDAIWSVKEAA